MSIQLQVQEGRQKFFNFLGHELTMDETMSTEDLFFQFNWYEDMIITKRVEVYKLLEEVAVWKQNKRYFAPSYEEDLKRRLAKLDAALSTLESVYNLCKTHAEERESRPFWQKLLDKLRRKAH